MIYDVIVVGAGPAGLAAGYASEQIEDFIQKGKGRRSNSKR